MPDLTIRGAGIFGLSIAWACVTRGARVRLVDPAGPGAGASGGIVGALAPHVPENWNEKKAFQLESLLAAAAFWQEVVATGGVDAGYARLGRIQPLADEAALDLARQRAETAKSLWGDAARWEVVRDAPGWVPPSPTGQYVHDTLSARIHPRRACAALVAALASRHVTVEAEAPLHGPQIWATGLSGLEALGAGRARSVGSGVKGQAALFAFDAHAHPQLFADTLHFVPHADGTLAIGSTSERSFADASRTDDALEALITRARSLVPALSDVPVLERWAGARPRARSRAPILGAWPDRPEHFVANGGFKIGFGMAPKVAEVMADLVLEGQNHIPPSFAVQASL